MQRRRHQRWRRQQIRHRRRKQQPLLLLLRRGRQLRRKWKAVFVITLSPTEQQKFNVYIILKLVKS
jgi:hypothetical protein